MVEADNGSGGPDLRQTGIPMLDALPWGAHICLFYETTQDLFEAVSRFFSAGLAKNEHCFWMLPEFLDPQSTASALRPSIADLDGHLRRGALELVREWEWFHGMEEVSLEVILDDLDARVQRALERGFAGVRGVSSAHWQEADLWPVYRQYEEVFTDAMSGVPVMVLSTHELSRASAAQIANVARVHQFSILLREGRWELLQTPWLAGRQQSVEAPALPAPRAFPGHERLTARETETLAALAGGASNKMVARMMGISPRTVEFHRANIMRKLHADSFAELLARVHGNR